MNISEIIGIILLSVPIAVIFLSGWIVGFGTNWLLRFLKKDDEDYEGI